MSTHSASPQKAAHLLLVEDDPEVRTGLDDFFSLEGYEVSSVETGTGALPAIRSVAPDLIILDLRLPGKDGFEVLREVREEGIEVPVFTLTALHKSAHKQRCFELGAEEYFTKPFDVELLSKRVADALGKQTEEKLRCD